MNKYKAVVFDLDGTLLNTIDDIADSANEALSTYGFESYSVEEYKMMVGDGARKLILRMLENHQIEPSFFQDIYDKYIEVYQIKGTNKTAPYDGINSLLSYLDASGIQSAVLSNKPHHDTQQIIAHYFPNHHFTKVYGKLDGYPTKPNPKKLNELIDELAVSKCEVLYVGDTLTDMQTAMNASLDKVGVLWGFRTIKELKQGNPEYLISHPKEMIDILKGFKK